MNGRTKDYDISEALRRANNMRRHGDGCAALALGWILLGTAAAIPLVAVIFC